MYPRRTPFPPSPTAIGLMSTQIFSHRSSTSSPQTLQNLFMARCKSTEFIKTDLTEDQILPVLRDLLPVLLSILGSTEVCLLTTLIPTKLTCFSRRKLPLLVQELSQSSANVSSHFSWSKTNTLKLSRKPLLACFQFGWRPSRSFSTWIPSKMSWMVVTGKALQSGSRYTKCAHLLSHFKFLLTIS